MKKSLMTLGTKNGIVATKYRYIFLQARMANKDSNTGNEQNDYYLGHGDPFKLEKVFEDASDIFNVNTLEDASSDDAIITVDTNVLLLPYTIRKDDLSALAKFYQGLRSAGRLYLPDRVAREFIVHRDKKLTELLQTINDVRSRINIGETRLSPIMEGMDGVEALSAASKALLEAKKEYTKALEVVEDNIKAWRGDDPVTAVYKSVFDKDNIVSPSEAQKDLLAEWEYRLKEKIPPGYKDRSKADTGIGDFLVWKTLLAIGAKHKKNMIFITGEEKADWFVRVNKIGVYPRPELVAEYRKHSGGKGIRLVELHDVLREMDVAQDVVIEVERAENSVNNAIRAGTAINLDWRNTTSITTPNTTTSARMRMRYGGESLIFSAGGIEFKFSVSECGPNSIWVYPNGIDEMFLVATVRTGEILHHLLKDAIEKAASISSGQLVCLRKASGHLLIARLLRANQPETGEIFEVSMSFAIYSPGETVYAP